MNVQILEHVLRVFGMLLALFLIAVFVFPMTVRVTNIGNIAGVVFAVWLFVISCKPLQQALSRLFHHNGFLTFLYRFVNGCFVAFIIYGAVVTAAMLIAANSKPADNATLVVLGAQVRPDETPSVILRGRIRAAEEYLNAHPDADAVLSGGQGYDEPMAESECMYREMTGDGIAPERLFQENQSKNTGENFRFSRQVMSENDLTNDMAIATDGFHMLRAMLIVRQQGIDAHAGAVCADTRIEFLPTYAVREWFAIPFQLLFRQQ